MGGTPVDTDSEEGPSVSADPWKMLHGLTMLAESKADKEAIVLLLSSITVKNANGTPDSPGRKRRSDTNDNRDKENKRNRQESQDTPNKTKRESNEAGSSRDKGKNDQLKCFICNIVYKTKWRFASHLKSHPDLCGIVILPDNSRRFCCALCGNRYSNKANVKRHIDGNHKITNLKCGSKDSRESKCKKEDSKVNEEQEGTAENSPSINEGSEDTAKEPTEQTEVRNKQSCSQKERPVILENRPVTVFCRECDTYIVHTAFKAHQEQHKMNYDKVPHDSNSEIIEEMPQEQNNNEMCNVPNNAQEGVVSRDESTVDQTNNSQFSTTVQEGNEQGDQEETYDTYDVHDGNTVSTSGFENNFSEEMDKDLKEELDKLFSITPNDNEIIEISDDSDGEENITQPNSTSSLRNSTDLNDILKDGKDNDNAITDDIVAPANETNNEQHPKESTSNGNNDESAKTDDTITPAKLAHEANNEISKAARSNANDDDNAKIGYIFAPENEGNNEEQPKAANSKVSNDDHATIDSIIAPAKETKNKEQLKEPSSNNNSNVTNSNGTSDDNIDKADDTLISANERNIGQSDESNSASNAILPSTSDLDIEEENEDGGQRNELQLLIEEERRIKDILSRRDDGTEG